MIAEHLLVIRLLGPCIPQGSTRKAEPAGDLYEEIYCIKLAMQLRAVGQASLKSVVQDARKDRLKLWLKLPSTG